MESDCWIPKYIEFQQEGYPHEWMSWPFSCWGNNSTWGYANQTTSDVQPQADVQLKGPDITALDWVHNLDPHSQPTSAKDARALTADHPNQANEYSIIASSAPRPEVEASDTQNEIKTDALAGLSSDEGTVKRPEGGDKPSASSNPVECSGQTAINPADTGVIPSAEVTSQELTCDDDS
ncbi:hypothetical protein FRC11_009278, partial [Ceratobasidium sp. 423]